MSLGSIGDCVMCLSDGGVGPVLLASVYREAAVLLVGVSGGIALALYFLSRRQEQHREIHRKELAATGMALDEAHRKLDLVQDELRRKEQLSTVGALASGVAHEFNNILAAMSGHAELARRRPEHIQKFLDIVSKQTERAIQITQGLLTFSKKGKPLPTHHELNELVQDVATLVSQEMERHRIELDLVLDDTLLEVPMVVVEIQQVLLNIVINARRAIGQGGRIGVSTRRVGSWAEVEISDTGRGIPESVRKRLFDLDFSDPGGAANAEPAGHGFGLSVSLRIVQQHQGTIAVESKVGEGTRFIIRLPLEPVTERATVSAPPPTEAVPTARRPVLRRGRVLVVDDEGDVRSLIRAIVADAGYEVDEAGDVPSGQAMARQTAYDCVFLDLSMPREQSGLEVLRAIKQGRPETRVVVVSGNLLDAQEREQIGPYVDSFVRKPFGVAAIVAAIEVAAIGAKERRGEGLAESVPQ